MPPWITVAAAAVTLSSITFLLLPIVFPPSSMSRPCPVARYHVNIVWLPGSRCLECDNYAEITNKFIPMVESSTSTPGTATDIALIVLLIVLPESGPELWLKACRRLIQVVTTKTGTSTKTSTGLKTASYALGILAKLSCL